MRLALVLIAALGLTACATPEDLSQPAEPLGDFRKGFAIVVAPSPQAPPLSRKAKPEEWIASMTTALDRRFDRFQGEKFYNLGVSVDGYFLAPPGVPVVAAPKSVLVVKVTVWDDAAGVKLNDEAHQLTVIETLDESSVVGSGFTRSREEQMADLSANAARAIETWMRRQPGWFAAAAGASQAPSN